MDSKLILKALVRFHKDFGTYQQLKNKRTIVDMLAMLEADTKEGIINLLWQIVNKIYAYKMNDDELRAHFLSSLCLLKFAKTMYLNDNINKNIAIDLVKNEFVYLKGLIGHDDFEIFVDENDINEMKEYYDYFKNMCNIVKIEMFSK